MSIAISWKSNSAEYISQDNVPLMSDWRLNGHSQNENFLFSHRAHAKEVSFPVLFLFAFRVEWNCISLAWYHPFSLCIFSIKKTCVSRIIVTGRFSFLWPRLPFYLSNIIFFATEYGLNIDFYITCLIWHLKFYFCY